MLEIEAPKRLYQNYLVDTVRWQSVPLRAGDIIVTTPPKTGTTWTQAIIAHLILGEEPWPDELHHLSPWVEMRGTPIEELAPLIEAQPHRRFIKSHIARDGLPFSPDVSYVVVGRDPRDVLMSLYNFRANWGEELIDLLSAAPGLVGDPVPPFEEDIHVFFDEWLTRGSFEWEQDGFPMMSTFHHLQSWWDERARPNVLLLHYGDMLRDLPAEIARLAAFLGVEISRARIDAIADATSFASMKKEAAKYTVAGGAFFRGGADSFIYKGTNGRWRDVLSEDELTRYDDVVARRVTPECARWLCAGRAGTL